MKKSNLEVFLTSKRCSLFTQRPFNTQGSNWVLRQTSIGTTTRISRIRKFHTPVSIILNSYPSVSMFGAIDTFMLDTFIVIHVLLISACPVLSTIIIMEVSRVAITLSKEKLDDVNVTRMRTATRSHLFNWAAKQIKA